MEAVKDAGQCGRYKVIKTLGEGATAKVKLAVSPDDQKLVAIKRFKEDVFENDDILNQIGMMKILSHPNLVKLLEMMEKTPCINESGQQFQADCMVLELVSEGELFDYIAIGGRFNQTTARTYFKMLLDGLKYMHGKGVCHRDIKPENLLLNSDFILKIADFGFATKAAGPNGDGILKDKLGTAGYMSPQIYTLKYHGDQVDIFAAGVVLFIMLSGHPPFQTATIMDPYFRTVKDKKHAMFWNLHSRKKPAGFYTDNFKSLIEGIITFNPEDRLSIDSILEHPWFKDQPTMNFEELKSDFEKRKDKVKEEKMRVKRQMAEKRSARNDAIFNRGNLNRDTADDITIMFLDLYEKEEKEDRKLKVKESLSDKDFIIKENPRVFFSTLFAYLQDSTYIHINEEDGLEFMPSYKIEDNQVSVQYCFDYEGLEEYVCFVITIMLTKKNNICLSFKHTSGSDIYYRYLVNKLKEQFLYGEVEE